jgi:DNA-binding MltR family transcriptional regulator
MAGAYLSDQLERLLKSFFAQEPTSVDELFGSTAPLGSFSARIDIAFACGLLPKMAQRDLHIIRRIRNDFGHVARQITFDEQSIKARCRELHYTFYEKERAPRARFTNTALGVCAIIHAGLARQERRTVPADPRWDDTRKEEVRDVVAEIARTILSDRLDDSGPKKADV